MLSLQDITTRSDGEIELETFQLVSEDRFMNSEARLFPISDLQAPAHFSVQDLHRFEWISGLGHRSFPFNGEENRMTVHKDLVDHIKRQKLAISPSAPLTSKALELIKFNRKVKSDGDRQRFEDFGSGPWEYVLFPTKGRGTLPQCFIRLRNGSTTPLPLDDSVSDYDALPRFTSMIHPLVFIFFRKRCSIDPHCVDKLLVPHLVAPIHRIVLQWPFWTHNRFLPKLTSPKRIRLSASERCRCSECGKWEYSAGSTSGSSSQEARSDSSDDSESWRDPVLVKEVTKDDPRVKDWRSQTERPSDDEVSDPILEEYSQEPSPPVSFTLGRLEEAMGLRIERLQLILDAVKRSRSEKSSRVRKRSRRS